MFLFTLKNPENSALEIPRLLDIPRIWVLQILCFVFKSIPWLFRETLACTVWSQDRKSKNTARMLRDDFDQGFAVGRRSMFLGSANDTCLILFALQAATTNHHTFEVYIKPYIAKLQRVAASWYRAALNVIWWPEEVPLIAHHLWCHDEASIHLDDMARKCAKWVQLWLHEDLHNKVPKRMETQFLLFPGGTSYLDSQNSSGSIVPSLKLNGV